MASTRVATISPAGPGTPRISTGPAPMVVRSSEAPPPEDFHSVQASVRTVSPRSWKEPSRALVEVTPETAPWSRTLARKETLLAWRTPAASSLPSASTFTPGARSPGRPFSQRVVAEVATVCPSTTNWAEVPLVTMPFHLDLGLRRAELRVLELDGGGGERPGHRGGGGPDLDEGAVHDAGRDGGAGAERHRVAGGARRA